MLAGDNSILQKATDAKTESEKGQEQEIVALAYNSALAKKVGNGDSTLVTSEDMNTELTNQGATANGSDPITVTFTASKRQYTINNGIVEYAGIETDNPIENGLEGLSSEEVALLPTGVTEIAYNDIENEDLKDSEKIKAVITGNVPIPKEATYVEGTVDTGVVIKYKNSEFVWIPVPVTENDDLYVKGTTKRMAKETSGTDANGKKNYQGALYNYSGITSTEKTNYGQETSSCREPDIVTGNSAGTGTSYDGNASYYNTILGYSSATDFKIALQQEYNKMIESVSKFGGFFVGRYETSYNETTNKVESISDVIPTGANNTNTQGWYGLYQKQKEFTESTDKMVSSMIWGSQYDAMLNWALEGADKSHVTATGYGNHTSSIKKTKAKTNDKINNIYDLEGNLREYTQEVGNTDARAARGGRYSDTYASSNSPNIRDYNSTPSSAGAYPNGSRLSLYIR